MDERERLFIDYQLNLLALEEMENIIPMTAVERDSLRKWVWKGHNPESNPWNYCDAEGYPLNYLHAFRLKHGSSNGPWDYWNGPGTQLLWDDLAKCYRSKDELW